MWRIEFSSVKFLPFLPEEAQANPGVYGYELAHWLCASLAKTGLVTTYPLGEDWGWLLEFLDDDLEIMVGCSSVCGEDEGYEGKPIDWSIFVEPRRSMKQKIFGTAPVAAAERLQEAIKSLLAAEGIEVRDVEA
ncbi:hypothetical protein HPT27_08030 [Permianibacter sp. IMCC34836]|uniref:hypothetical protein n=1 Tax=Permianibacter fluminis TaxID=2738515 RepID=UPI001555517A|nr:hypothetical protein [Permianibacter fluminis]NQD36970.1 hypothetical protein [Permianibacter fluminis]